MNKVIEWFYPRFDYLLEKSKSINITNNKIVVKYNRNRLSDEYLEGLYIYMYRQINNEPWYIECTSRTVTLTIEVSMEYIERNLVVR